MVCFSITYCNHVLGYTVYASYLGTGTLRVIWQEHILSSSADVDTKLWGSKKDPCRQIYCLSPKTTYGEASYVLSVGVLSCDMDLAVLESHCHCRD